MFDMTGKKSSDVGRRTAPLLGTTPLEPHQPSPAAGGEVQMENHVRSFTVDPSVGREGVDHVSSLRVDEPPAFCYYCGGFLANGLSIRLMKAGSKCARCNSVIDRVAYAGHPHNESIRFSGFTVGGRLGIIPPEAPEPEVEAETVALKDNSFVGGLLGF